MDGSSDVAPSDSVSQVGGPSPVPKLALVPYEAQFARSLPASVSAPACSKSFGIGQRAFQCVKCKMQKPISDLAKGKRNECQRDTASYKSLAERWAKNRGLRVWWNSLTATQIVEWYRKQQSLPAGTKRRFDNVTYSEATSQSVGSEDRDRVWYQPYSIYEEENMKKGRTALQCQGDWKDLVESPMTEATYDDESGEWLVPKWLGIMKDKVRSNLSSSSTTRDKNVQSVDDLHNLQAGGAKLLTDYFATLHHPKMERSAAPAVETTTSEQPSTPGPVNTAAAAMSREVQAKVREDTMRLQFEGEDLTAALMVAPSVSSGGSTQQTIASVDKVKFASSCMLAQEKIKDQAHSINQAFTSMSVTLGGLETETSKRHVPEMLEELGNSKDKALHYIGARRVAVESIGEDAVRCTTLFSMTGLKTRLNVETKNLLKAEVLLWTQTLRKMRTWAEKEKRVEASKDAHVGAAQTGYKSERLLMLEEITADMKGHCVSGSVFEAKAGVRVCLIAPSHGLDPVGMLLRLPITKSSFKNLAAHLKVEPWGVVNLQEDTKKKKLMKILAGCFDTALFARLTLPDTDWSKLVYDLQFMGMQRGFVHAGVTHMCCMEARVLLEGTETVMGAETAKVPGVTVLEKRRWLWEANKLELLEVFRKDGFCFTHDSTKAIIIPSGFLCIIFASEGAKGVRWSVSSDTADTSRVTYGLTNLLTSFPDMKKASLGYAPFLGFLEAE